MSIEVTTSSSTIPGNFTFNYAEIKFKHECTHCGFEADLYESSAEYECPICRRGTMCRPAQDLMWYQDRDSNWAALQEGFYADGNSSLVTGGAASPPMIDGYLLPGGKR